MTATPYTTALQHGVLSKERELDLFTRYGKLRARHGAQHAKTLVVRNEIVRSNLRAVAKMAKRYTKLPFEDLLGEGVKGLITAAEKFEVGRGWRFGTYATHWIRHALQRACMDTGDIVRVPVHKQESLSNGRLLPDGVRLLGRPLSMDAPFDADGGCLYDVIASEAREAVDELGDGQCASELRRIVSDVLTPREREIVERRFLSESDETLKDVGDRLGVCRERVRQVQNDALKKLRIALSRAGMDRGAI